MINKLPVVVIFCYNRLSHLKKTISSLKKNYNYKKYQIFIFSDGAKNIVDYQKIKKIRIYLKSLNNKKIKIVYNKKNIGLKKNVINGLNLVFKKNEKAIIVEDDLILNKFFLNYMTESLEFYSIKDNVGSISSYTPIKSSYSTFKDDVYFSRRHYSWGWATWSKIWNNFVFDNKKLKKKITKKKLNDFKKIGKDLPILLDLSLKNKISSWSIFFDYNCYINKLLCVCPKYSIVKNLGFDNSGTHEHQDFLNNHYKKKWIPKKLVNPVLSKKIEKLERLSIEGNVVQKLKNKIFKIKNLIKDIL